MSKSPFFSVIVPTYNQAQYLGTALDSVLAQTNPNWEAIIINDGSTDSTAEVLEKYTAKDTRFKVVHKDNGGVASALNLGLKLAQGEWICWLSSDDLFESNKLEVHQTWINNFPHCQFFFSHFKYLEDSTGIVTEPPLWRSIPEQEWQIVEMLGCTYVHGNSICVNRKAWDATGKFNEELKYGQDYDMWLRLIALYPAIFIPERTYITRFHTLQGSTVFREACFFDSARAAINFLNQNSFEKLFPLIDLIDQKTAINALKKSLDIASANHCFLYALGTHPALIWRIIEYFQNHEDANLSRQAKRIIEKRSEKLSKQYEQQPFGFLWKLVNLVCKIYQTEFNYQPVDFRMIAELNYWWLSGQNLPEGKSLYAYLEKFTNYPLPTLNFPSQIKGREIFFIAQKGSTINQDIKYGALRSTLEIAKYLQTSGNMVVLIGLSPQSMGFTEGLLFIGTQTETDLQKCLLSLKHADILNSHMIIDYKGADIALKTFTVIKEKFSNAIFNISRLLKSFTSSSLTKRYKNNIK